MTINLEFGQKTFWAVENISEERNQPAKSFPLCNNHMAWKCDTNYILRNNQYETHESNSIRKIALTKRTHPRTKFKHIDYRMRKTKKKSHVVGSLDTSASKDTNKTSYGESNYSLRATRRTKGHQQCKSIWTDALPETDVMAGWVLTFAVVTPERIIF